MEGWNGQKAFTFYASFADFGDILSERDQKELYFSIVRYMFFDQDREEKLSKAARAAFRQIKATCKMSRANSRNGSVPKSKRIANESETNAERNENENVTKSKSKSKSNSNSNSNSKAMRSAACPKCGGPLDWTAASTPTARGTRRMYVCRACGEEVWRDE